MIKKLIHKIKENKAWKILMHSCDMCMLYMTDELDSPFTKIIDGKRYVYCTLSRCYRYDNGNYSISLKYRGVDSLGVISKTMDVSDMVDFFSKLKILTLDEFVANTKMFDIDEIRDEFKVGSYIDHNDRVYRIDYILSSHSTNTCEGWPSQYIIFGLSAADVHTRVYFFDLNKFRECVKRVDKDAFIKSEEEYLKRKKEEFESLKEGDIRYCWKKYDPYGYITLAKIVRTYMTSGENNMFVEYELHNMSDRTNKVETFIKEFNDFRHTFTDSDLNAIGLSI